MYVNQHMIKICFTEDGHAGEERKGMFSASKGRAGGNYGSNREAAEVISLKYTIDYPRVELHPFDTRKFQLFYADTKMNAQYDCNRCLEMKATSRQTRDIIALLIRCFSAQTYFINSKIMASVRNGEDLA